MCLLKSAYALFEQFKSFTLLLFLHLKQIAPPTLTAIIKSFFSLGACRKSAERQSEEKEKTFGTCLGGETKYTHKEGIVKRHFLQQVKHVLHF